MMEEPGIIEMNIARYREMLNRHLDDETRSRVEQLLGEAKCRLALAMDLKNPRWGPGKDRCQETLA